METSNDITVTTSTTCCNVSSEHRSTSISQNVSSTTPTADDRFTQSLLPLNSSSEQDSSNQDYLLIQNTTHEIQESCDENKNHYKKPAIKNNGKWAHFFKTIRSSDLNKVNNSITSPKLSSINTTSSTNASMSLKPSRPTLHVMKGSLDETPVVLEATSTEIHTPNIPVESTPIFYHSSILKTSSDSSTAQRTHRKSHSHRKKKGTHRYLFNRLIAHPGQRLPSSQTSPNESLSTSIETAWTNFQLHMSKSWNSFVGPTVEVPDLPIYLQQPIGFSFSPAGLLLPYHLGVAECLRQFNMLTAQTPIAGASAGALCVATIACDVPTITAMKIVYQVEEDLRTHGAARRLHSVLLKHLEELLPGDAHDFFNTREGRACIAYTQVWPLPKGQFTANFTSRDDLRDCLVASCNIPFYFSRWPTVTCRGYPCVDGYFSVSRRHFGCPKTTARRDIRVLPFSPKAVHVTFPESDCISPDLQRFDRLLDDATNGQFSKDWEAYIQASPAPSPPSIYQSYPFSSEQYGVNFSESSRDTDPSAEQRQRDSEIGLDRLGRMWGIWDAGGWFSNSRCSSVDPPTQPPSGLPVLRYSIHQLLQIALDAAEDPIAMELFDLGRADAFRWVKLEAMNRAQITRTVGGLEEESETRSSVPLEAYSVLFGVKSTSDLPLEEIGSPGVEEGSTIEITEILKEGSLITETRHLDPEMRAEIISEITDSMNDIEERDREDGAVEVLLVEASASEKTHQSSDKEIENTVETIDVHKKGIQQIERNESRLDLEERDKLSGRHLLQKKLLPAEEKTIDDTFI